jgi:hypothetical protein
MTALGRARKSRLSHRRSTPLAAALVIAALAAAGLLRAATTERVVADRNTGLAISGFDPVAYFMGEAAPGKGDFEYAFAGAVWRFRSEGDRAAFIASPHIYMPRFGGYDPEGVARGVAVPGNPELWLVAGERLYLFFSPEGRQAFVDAPDRLIGYAEQRWPEVRHNLVP